MQTKNINLDQASIDCGSQKILLQQPETVEEVPPLPPRSAIIFTPLCPSTKLQVEVEGYGPYKPVPPPKPLPQQTSGCLTPPPYRMPPYPLYGEPNIPGAAGLDSPAGSSSAASPQSLQTHSNKFPIEREVILSNADKNSKIPILHEYKKRSKAAIAPDIPPKQLAAWTQAQGQVPQQGQILASDQSQNIQNAPESGALYRPSYQDYYNGQGLSMGAVPRSSWHSEQKACTRQQVDEPAIQTVSVQIESGKDNLQKDSSKNSKSMAKTYHTIKDMISSRFKSTKDSSDDKMDETGLNNMSEELRKSVRSVDRLGEEVEERVNVKKHAGEQGIYGKPRTDQTMSIQQHHYNHHMMQQHILAQQALQSHQAMQQYQVSQLKNNQQSYPQLATSRSQDMMGARPQEQLYYQNAYPSTPQRPSQRYGVPQTAEQNYVLMHHQQASLRDAAEKSEDRRLSNEKRSAQQLERDNLRQRSFEARRAASHPQLTYDEDNKIEVPDKPQPQMIQGRRGSHGNIIETIQTSIDAEKDSDDGGFLRRERRLDCDNDSVNKCEDGSRDDAKITEGLMGTPRKRLEGEIGKIEGVYNVNQRLVKTKPDGEEIRNGKKQSASSGTSSDYDKGGQPSSNADSGRGSAAYSSGRRTGVTGIDTHNESSDPHQCNRDVHTPGNESEWVDIVENELRTILEPKLHELSLQGNNVGIANSTLSESISSMTPPLPPLSPEDHSSPNVTPRNSARYKHSSLPHGSKPEYGHDGYGKQVKAYPGALNSNNRWHGASPQKHRTGKKIDHAAVLRGKQMFGLDTTDLTSNTTRSLDLESMLEGQSDSEGDISTTDARAIRRQLESLEGMYSEVLKILGVKKYAGRYQPSDPRFSRRRYGSMSSLPSSSVSSRPIRDKRRGHEERKKVKDIRGINKRFQRLESHVVTLARSVAHLSSEMRTQHLMIQEMENIRGEIAALRTQTNMLNIRSQSANRAANGSKDLPSLTNPARVKKLTKFFGDEPPLLRIFLKKLGYEKYANIFENERVGMVELPYLSEERLQKMGVPLGPRLRILQEAQISVCKDTTLCVV